MTWDMQHVKHGGLWTFSQNVNSLALWFGINECFKDLEKKDHLLTLLKWITKVFVEQPRLHRVCEKMHSTDPLD